MNDIKLTDGELWTVINGLNAAADALNEDAEKCGPLGAALKEAAFSYKQLAGKLEEQYA
jgi:hypothetical protein